MSPLSEWAQVPANWLLKWPVAYKLPLIVTQFPFMALVLLFLLLSPPSVLVDKKEIGHLYTAFVRECPSGRMTRTDLLRIYRQFFPFGDVEPFVDKFLRLFSGEINESNGAGGNGGSSIEFHDYVTGLSVISRGRLDEKLSWAFRFCDGNGDGWIDLDELTEGIEIIHRLAGYLLCETAAPQKREKDLVIEAETADQRNTDLATDIDAEENHQHETRVVPAVSGALVLTTPGLKAERLFKIMDEDCDGKANFSDFKRTILQDPDTIKGFLIYDGVI